MENCKCPTCGASMKKYWHRLTPGLVQSLKVMFLVIKQNEENIVSKKQLNLNHSQYGNFQKLRFHGLIAKHIVDGKWNKGEWLITSRGFGFLRGQLAVPVKVQTFRNKVTDHDVESVYITDVWKDAEYWQKDFEYDVEKPKQTGLF